MTHSLFLRQHSIALTLIPHSWPLQSHVFIKTLSKLQSQQLQLFTRYLCSEGAEQRTFDFSAMLCSEVKQGDAASCCSSLYCQLAVSYLCHIFWILRALLLSSVFESTPQAVLRRWLVGEARGVLSGEIDVCSQLRVRARCCWLRVQC